MGASESDAPFGSTTAGALSRGHVLAMLGLMALAAIPRLLNLGYPGLSGNEDYVVLCARAILEHGIPVFPSGGLYPRAFPFSYATAAMVAAFGGSEAVLRFVPACFSIATVGLGYAFARRALGTGPAVVAGLVLALSPWEIVMGRTARMYSALAFFFLLALYATYRVVTENNARWRAPAIAAGMLAVSLHQLAAVLVLPYVALLWLARPATRRNFLLASVAIVAVTTLAVMTFERSVYAGFGRHVAAARILDGGATADGPSGIGGDTEVRASKAHSKTRALSRPGPALSAALVATALGAAGAAWWLGRSAGFAFAVLVTTALIGFQYAMLAAYAASAYVVLGFVSGRLSGWRRAFGLGAVLAVGGAAWLAVGIAKGGASSATPVVRALVDWPPNFLEFLVRLSPGMFLVAVLAALVALVGYSRDRNAFTPHLYLASALFLSGIGLGFHPSAPDLFNDRYVFHLNASFVLLYAFGIWWLAARVAAAVGAARGGWRGNALVTAAAAAVLLFVTGGLAPAGTRAAATLDYGENRGFRDAWGEASYIPDHQGSSRHVCENAGPDDVIVAMDVLIHWVYCPRADFQLTLSPKGDAEGWIGIRSGSSLDPLAAVIAERRAPRVWIVLAGQKTRTKREDADPRLEAMLAFRTWGCAEKVYVGRDGASDVWMLERSCLEQNLPSLAATLRP